MNQLENLRAVMFEADVQARKRFPANWNADKEDQILERCRTLLRLSAFVHEATDEQLRELVSCFEPDFGVALQDAAEVALQIVCSREEFYAELERELAEPLDEEDRVKPGNPGGYDYHEDAPQ